MSDDETHRDGERNRPVGPPKLTLVSSHDDITPPATAEPHDNDSAPAVHATTPSAALTPFPATNNAQKLRIVEALLFASPEPVSRADLAKHLDDNDDIEALVDELKSQYEKRGVNLVTVAGKWTLRTAEDLGYLLQEYAVETRRLSKAALETLAIIAYHQPVTRAEVEEVRGVSTSAGTLDILLETGWVRLRGRRRAPGRPVTYGTTDAFLTHFSLESIKDLPGLNELKGAGLLDSALPPNFQMPEPSDVAALMPDELPLEDDGQDNDEPEIELPFGEDDVASETAGAYQEDDSDAGENTGDIGDIATPNTRPAG